MLHKVGIEEVERETCVMTSKERVRHLVNLVNLMKQTDGLMFPPNQVRAYI